MTSPSQARAVLLLLVLASTSTFAKLSKTYNVMTFGGANCDGATDDTAAIQSPNATVLSAITRSGGNGGRAYFPPFIRPMQVLPVDTREPGG